MTSRRPPRELAHGGPRGATGILTALLLQTRGSLAYLTAPISSTRRLSPRSLAPISPSVATSGGREGRRMMAIMSYLDSLSPEGHEENSDVPKKRRRRSPPKSGENRKGGGGTVVPSGRGPEASYLECMTSPAFQRGSNDSEQQEEEDDSCSAAPESEKDKRAKGWSGMYLTDFLTGNDDARTDVRNLLTQRAIQTFMYLLEQCRDPHSAKWIMEDFLETGNLLDFHGSGAGFIERFGGTWDAPLLEMVKRPPTELIVSAKRRGRGHGGWSKDNPFIEERWFEVPIDIDPARLAARILAVREQIASEWERDLDLAVQANDMILDSYFAKVSAGRVGDNGTGEALRSSMDVAFDRVAVNLIGDATNFAAEASSPFRRGNFDLVYNLCTQAAVHRLLRKHRADGEDERNSVPFAFLKDFYTERAAEYFDGDLRFGQADDFIDELLQTSPMVLKTSDGKTGIVDPLGTAERIIRMRSEVAAEWKEAMGKVPEDHTGIRQALLTRSWLDEPKDDDVADEILPDGDVTDEILPDDDEESLAFQ